MKLYEMHVGWTETSKEFVYRKLQHVFTTNEAALTIRVTK